MSGIHANCDKSIALAGQAQPTAHPRLVLVATILASSLAFIDGSVVNVGLPAIGHSLNAQAAELPWIINAYLLPLSALLLFGGAAGDRFGRRRLLIVGVLLFALASIGCALAPTLDWLLAGRAIQGGGAALVLPNSLAILGGAFSDEARGRAIGIWAAVGAMAGAIGPVLGGWLIDVVGWRAIFFVNLPVAAGALFFAWRFVDKARDAEPAPLDAPGALLATVGLGALTWGLTIGSSPAGWTGLATSLLGIGAVSSAAFLIVEHRLGDRAMMPLALFASRQFVGLTLLTFLVYGALGALLVLVPYELIRAAGYSATAAGAALLPFPVVMAAASPRLGALAGRIGSRTLLAGGCLLVTAGFALAMRIGSGGYWATTFPAVLVISLGMAGVAAPLTTAVLGSVDLRHTGSASGLNSAVARTGGLVATALLSTVLSSSGEALTPRFCVALLLGALAVAGGGASTLMLAAPRPADR